MYIQKIILNDFLSYRNIVIVDDLSSRQNIILGRNGCGKSNFMKAIEFVLSDEYRSLTQSQRLSLMHQDKNVRSASVTIVLHDAQTDRELVLKRKVSATKDECFKDSRPISKKQLYAHLQSLGFVTHKPCNILQQTRITDIATSSCKQRLLLLQEVFGIKFFQQRVESATQMIIACKFNAAIDKNWSILRQHFDVVQMDKNMFNEFKTLESHLRGCSLFLANHEIDKLARRLQENQAKYDDNVWLDLEDAKQLLAKSEQDVQKCTEQLRQLEIESVKCTKEHKAVLDQKNAIDRQSCRASLRIAELSSFAEQYNEKNVEAQNVRMQIAEKQQHFERVAARYDAHKTQETNCNNELLEKRKTLEVLQFKQRNSTQFQKLCDELANESSDEEYDENMNELQQSLLYAEDLEMQYNATLRSEDHIGKAFEQMKQKLSVQMEFTEAEICQSFEMQRNIMKSKTEVEPIAKYKELLQFEQLEDLFNGYHGCVWNVLKVKSDQFACLLNISLLEDRFTIHLVDNEIVARQIEAHLSSVSYTGSFNYLSLDAIEAVPELHPETLDYLPFLKQFTYSDTYTAVLTHLFGRTIICSNFDACYKYSTKFGYEAIALDGHGVSTHKTVSIGFNHLNEEEQNIQKALKQQFTEEELSLEFEKEENRVHRLINDVEIVLRDQHDWMQTASSSLVLQKWETDTDTTLVDAKQLVFDLNQHQRLTKRAMQEHQQSSQFSEEENHQMITLLEDVGKLQTSVEHVSTAMKQLETEKRLAGQTLNALTSYCKPLEDFLAQHPITDISGLEVTLNKSKSDYAQIIELCRIHENRSAEVSNMLSEHRAQLQELIQKKLDAKQTQQEAHAAAEELHHELKRLRESHLTKLRERENLGTMPSSDILQTYQRFPYNALTKEAKSLKNKLAEYAHIDLHALNAFEVYNNAFVVLENEHSLLEQLVARFMSLRPLLLEQNAQEEGFRKLHVEFRALFDAFMVNGRGNLVKVHESRSSQTTNESDSVAEEQWNGIDVQVQFPNSCVMKNIRSLSGGEKCLISLMIIFAIQQQHPSSFYILDEADASLDECNRKRLARAVKELSRNAQYIITSHRPELIQFADQHYCIRMLGGNSYVNCVNKTVAFASVEDD